MSSYLKTWKVEEGGVDSSNLTDEQFFVLSKGFGDQAVVETLCRGQNSKFLFTFSSIIELAPSDAISEAVYLLERALVSNEPVVFEIFSYPHISVWAWACLERLMGVSQAGSVKDHLQYLSSIAAVAAFRGQIGDFEIEVPLRGGGVVLPSLGRARFGDEDLNGFAVARCESGRLNLTYADHVIDVPLNSNADSLEWESIRFIHVSSQGLELSVAIDDIDPYRNFYSLAALAPPSNRLDDVGIKTWQEAVADAWSLLTRHHYEYASSISAGIKVLVPMEVEVHRHDRSLHAFGSIALANISPRWIAYALLEEFQRAKISALDYLHPLHNATHEELKYIGMWTDRPRSFRHLLESYYSAPAVVKFWESQSVVAAVAEDRLRAQLTALSWRLWTRETRSILLNSGELTELGQEFVRSTQNPTELPLSKEFIPEIADFAVWLDLNKRIGWRLQNLAPTTNTIMTLLEAWKQGDSCPTDLVLEIEVCTSPQINRWRVHQSIAIIKYSDSKLYKELQSDFYYLRGLIPGAIDGDVQLLDGQLEVAKVLYRKYIDENVQDMEAWLGLIMSCQEFSEVAAVNTLNRFPEVAITLCGKLHEQGQQVELLNVASWLAPVLSEKDPALFNASAEYFQSLGS